MLIKFTLETNKVGSKVETHIVVDDEEWGELSDTERRDYAREMFWDIALFRLGDWNWEVVPKEQT